MPSLSADHPEYDPGGGYWLGGVWPPTNYMILRGLGRAGYNDLAHEISREDLDNVVRVYKDTGTLWENYAPERAAQGNRAKDDFVGWSGLAPSQDSSSTCSGFAPTPQTAGFYGTYGSWKVTASTATRSAATAFSISPAQPAPQPEMSRE